VKYSRHPDPATRRISNAEASRRRWETQMAQRAAMFDIDPKLRESFESVFGPLPHPFPGRLG
jgi:hypothetical protein